MSVAKYITTVVVAVPLFIVFGFQQPFYILILMASVAIGSGHLVETLIARSQPSTDVNPEPVTPENRKAN